MGLLILRSTASAAAWEDVTTTFSGMPAELATDSRKVRLRIDSSGSDWGQAVDTVNGASVTRIAGGAWDGTDCIRIVPPSSQIDNPSNTYSCILRELDLSNGGTKDVSRVTVGYVARYGSTYWNLGHQAKLTGILPSQTIGGDTNVITRAAIYEAFWDEGGGDLRRVLSVICGGVAEYYEPPIGGFQDPAHFADVLMALGATINHANDPPLVGTEDLYIEQNVDFRQTGSNANGRNRVDVWSRTTGYIGFLSVALNNRPDWDFSYQYGRTVEYVGGSLWNEPAIDPIDANCYIDVSNPIVSVNRPWGSMIGPPW